MKKHPFLPITGALSLLVTAIPFTGTAQNALQRATDDLQVRSEAVVTASPGTTPFYLSANRYGLSGTDGGYGYLRGGLFRAAEADSAHRWRIGYGIDVAAAYDMTSSFVIQQLYADFDWRAIRLTVGSKERPSELKNALLSTGGLTASMNARPVPQVRLGLPEFWNIPGTHGWLAIKGHVAYGRFTDDSWQEDFHAPGEHYAKGVYYHSKAGFLRIGNKEKFPLTFTGGLEMYAQFGGEAWNIGYRADGNSSGFTGDYVNMNDGLKGFWNAFIPGGSDERDGDFANVAGNQLGSWHFSLDYHGRGWGIRGYAEHYFEDHSQMFLEYGWKDMLWGAEIQLPKNPFVSTVLYEHLRTTDQTGSVYHDATPQLPYQISGADNYYNHQCYGAWQHWGQVMGNPLLVSPIYNTDGTITVKHNRITAHHFGIAGRPTDEIDYRVLLTHVRSLGTYAEPVIDPVHANYWMAEAGYAPRWAKGFALRAAVASNGGDLLGKSTGALISLRWNGNFR